MTTPSTDDETIERFFQVVNNALLDLKHEYLGTEAARFAHKAEKYRKLSKQDELYYRNATLDLKRILVDKVQWMNKIDREGVMGGGMKGVEDLMVGSCCSGMRKVTCPECYG
jgi:hypothetical protein